ncbi:hypothetical protein, partial [Klebsiella quasipneumoniae]|uniref:hypothetical protein n=1 Tax=Klebsiella quasipneumoniae TaxID=1463165 RepID=UPI002731ECA3
ATLSSPNQLCDHRLLNRLISTCQTLYQHLSTTSSATTLLRDQILLSHVIRDPQPVDQRLSAD